MELLTKGQRHWITTKTIKTGSFYMFPRFGFTVYEKPEYGNGSRMDTNPFTKSLDHEYFRVKEKVNGFVKGNFVNNPHYSDFYLSEQELSQRGLFECLFLLVITFVPFLVYNLLTNKN